MLYLNQNTIINNNLKSSTQEMNMQKNGEEYELFVQDIYKILNCADGLKDVVVQHAELESELPVCKFKF